MEFNKESFISPNYTFQDYKELEFSINSDNNTWEKAIAIFRDRIEGYYLNPIKILMNDKPKEHSFIVISILSLLIETLYQFGEGLDATEFRQNKTKYSAFLSTKFSCFLNSAISKKFYEDIRCGVLHSGQVKGKTKITVDEGYTVKVSNGILFVSVTQLLKEITDYFSNYVLELKDIQNHQLRDNFVKKMNFVCKLNKK